MGTEIDYAAVLADLEAKRAAIDNMISGIRKMLNLGAEQGVGGSATSNERRDQPPTSLRFDTFFQMSLPSAIKKFLEIAKAPQSVSEITRALLEGGFKTTSKNLMPIVGSNLSRMKSAGEGVNIDGKWGLASWYPAVRAQVAAKPKKGKRGRPKGSSKSKAAAITLGPAAKSSPVESQRKSTLFAPKIAPEQAQQIRARADAGVSKKGIAREFGISPSGVRYILDKRAPKASSENEGPKLRVVSKEPETSEAKETA